MAGETDTGRRRIAWQRQNRRDSAVTVENLDSHPRGDIGSSIAVHADFTGPTVIRPAGYIKIIESRPSIQSSVGTDTITQSGLARDSAQQIAKGHRV